MTETDAGNQVSTRAERRSFTPWIGALLIVLGLAVSASLLESTILPSGTIVGTTRRAAVFGLGRILLVVAGAYLVFRGPRITVIHLAALVPGLLLAGVLGSVMVQVAYKPPKIVSGWRSLAPAQEQNGLGFRGQPIEYSPTDYVVVLLGDSQVEAAALPLRGMPERRLEASLSDGGRKTKVFSIGAGGYGQDQQLLALEEYFRKYRADLVVLWQTPGNDVWNNVFKTHMYNRNPKPTFWMDSAGKLDGPSESLGQSLGDSPIRVVALWQRAFGLPWRDKSWERHLPEPYAPMDQYDGPTNTDWQHRWDANLGRMRDEQLETEKSHLAVALTPRSKRMQYGLDLTRALTKRIQEVTAAHGGRLVLFYQIDPSTAAEPDQVYVLNKKYYRVSQRQFHENWSYVNHGFDEEPIPLTVKDWRVGPEDGHLNQRATDQVMEDLAARLRSRIAATAATSGTNSRIKE